jgi:hypothetical protein
MSKGQEINFTKEDLEIFEERLSRVIATFTKNLSGLVKYRRPEVEIETLLDITINHSLVNLILSSSFYSEGTPVHEYEPYQDAVARLHAIYEKATSKKAKVA